MNERDSLNFLEKYSKDNNYNFYIISDKSTYFTIKKILQFRKKNKIKLKRLELDNKLKQGYTILISNKYGNYILIPLPKNKEKEFLDKFLNYSLNK